ncbi:hypothetical protein CRG98_004821 [Punica granatum]|uniref:Uncharacterized protein n=1 Tax=Punica granatum TaxID=22663 RepID=A0A2I0L2F1_PUNGR|nr:hypothetical protein CRG98_004821 [Punica granatum]
MCSRRGLHARDQIARLGSVHLPGERVTDTRENESPLPVYDPKVEAREWGVEPRDRWLGRWTPSAMRPISRA